MLLKVTVSGLVVLGSLFAQSPERPACNARTRGTLWPPRPSNDPRASVELCTAKRWKYRWEPLTVHISELGKNTVRTRPREVAKVTKTPGGGQ